jgi:Transcriptional regulator, AbiEi antitoxin/Protein of unknown function (DUF559)/AbiEi antitoxin C-terminal domain
MPGVGPITTTYWTESARPPGEGALDRAIAELASRQHAVVSLVQLKALGLSESAVRSRVGAGRLHRVHRGVYAVGHPLLTVRGRLMAAVLACGRDAVLSHRSAAELWGLRDSARANIDVTSPRRAGRSRGGIDVHRADTLQPDDVTDHDTIPCTTVARTLLDLADVVNRRQLERACDEADVRRLLDATALDAVLSRANGRRGAPVLRAILAEYDIGEGITRNDFEEAFLALCDRAGLPRPEINVWIALPDGGHAQADFLWRDRRLIVETDGRAAHATRRAFEHDRRRDQRLLVAGWRVIRVTWRRLTQEPEELAGILHALLLAHAGQRA